MEDSVFLGGAFTRYLKPHCNQSEVIHACWINRGDTALSLFIAKEYDTKDSLILRFEVSHYPATALAFGSGSSRKR